MTGEFSRVFVRNIGLRYDGSDFALDGLHHEQIKAAIRIKFGSVGAFERQQQLPNKSVHDVLRGRSVRQTEDAIATFLAMPVETLFPRRAPEKGSECSDDTSEKSDAHRLNTTAR